MEAYLRSFCLVILAGEVVSKCDFPSHKQDEAFEKTLQRLKPLLDKPHRYDTQDYLNDGYTYTIGICTSAALDDQPSDKYKTAGVIQRKKKQKGEQPETYIVGQYTDARIMEGSNWILLEYGKGDNYTTHCNKTPRKASIMIICALGELQGKMTLIEENNRKNEECYYLFELEHIAACPNVSGMDKLGAGSVVVIVFLVIAGIYLLGGFIYQRFIVGAKGFEQLPNFAFWQDFGNLQADGCDFICRCGGKTAHSKQYRGIGDDQLQSDDVEVERDDRLLPM